MQTNAALPFGSSLPGTLQNSPLQGGGSLSAHNRPDSVSAAREFESVFVSMMLKTMRQSMSENMFAGDDSDTFGGMFDAFMGQHIAENGGIGLTKLFAASGASAGLSSSLPAAAATIAPLAPQDIQNHTDQLKAYKHAEAIGG